MHLEGYSAFQQIAEAVLGLRWPRSHFAMLTGFTGYYDRSHAKMRDPRDFDQVTVVAGWVASAERWRAFEGPWKEALADFEVPYFHMKRFAHSKGPFATWKDDEPKRIAFLTALGAVVADTVQYGVAATVFHNGFSRAADSYDLRSTFKNEYVLAGRACVEGAKEWMHAQGIYNSPQLLRQEFEDGDEGKGALSDLLEADGFRRPNFEPSRDNAKGDRIGVVQLQAADFLAYEVMQVYTMVWPPTEWPPRFRESSRVVLSIDATDVEHMIWDYSSVAAECERRGIMRHGDGEGRNREDPTHS